MSNDFSENEVVAFNKLLEKYDDELVLSRNVSRYDTDATSMERSGYTEWRPQPYIAQSFDGVDQSANFQNITQLSVPGQVNIWKSSPWTMTPKQLNDSLQNDRFGEAAMQKLSSDINVAVMNVAANQGTMVVKRAAAAAGFADIAKCEEIMNSQGVNARDRYLALSTADYNDLAAGLAGNETLTPKALKAYEEAYVGRIASFDTYKLDYANRKAAALGTTVTVNGANQYHTPLATRSAAGGTGEKSNVDNRTQELAVTVSSGTIAVGDCFTIAGVYAVHHITKQSTGVLKTFRVTSLLSSGGTSGTIQISPPIISNGGSTDAEAAYKNVNSTPASGAALVWLNVAEAPVNPFWTKNAIEIMPGKFQVPEGQGLKSLSATTGQGISLTLSKSTNIDTLISKYRMDVFFGVTMLQPEMAGVILFGQT